MTAAVPPLLLAETGLQLEGLRCAGCVHRVEQALRALPGVASASVSYATHRAWVEHERQRIDTPDLVACIQSLGYTATPYDPEVVDRPARAHAREALIRLLAASFLAANVMLVSLALYLGTDSIDETTRRALRWLAIALSVPSVTWCALPFWRGAWSGLRRRELTLDVPVVLGFGTAFVVSIAGTLAETTHVFADSASMIVFLILLGRTLEGSARARAATAVERFVHLAPETALRRTAHGLETVPATALEVGDCVVVAPGQAFPADGRVARGATEVDESLLSGESQPVLRRVGESVTGGTRNLLAEVEVTVSARVETGTLARIAALLERAQAERPRVQRLVDRVSRIFAPAVLSAAAATAMVWTLAGAPAVQVALTAASVLIWPAPVPSASQRPWRSSLRSVAQRDLAFSLRAERRSSAARMPGWLSSTRRGPSRRLDFRSQRLCRAGVRMLPPCLRRQPPWRAPLRIPSRLRSGRRPSAQAWPKQKQHRTRSFPAEGWWREIRIPPYDDSWARGRSFRSTGSRWSPSSKRRRARPWTAGRAWPSSREQALLAKERSGSSA